MSTPSGGRRFLETTRGRIVALLRRGTRTVDELARHLSMTDNAVRAHLATLERDGLVRQEGVRRGRGPGKPAVLYELDAQAESLLSNAYPPVLGAVLDALVDRLAADEAEAVLRQAGRALARGAGGPASGELPDRVRAAAVVLTMLGGEAEVVAEGDGMRLHGYACPVAAIASRRPEICRAVEALVSEIVGAPARECCDRAGRPRCCFSIDPVT